MTSILEDRWGISRRGKEPEQKAPIVKDLEHGQEKNPSLLKQRVKAKS